MKKDVIIEYMEIDVPWENKEAIPEEPEIVEKPPVTTTLSDRLKQIRRDHHLSVKAIAESIYVTQATWTAYERGISSPSPSVRWYLQCVYHVNEDWLESGAGEIYEDGYKPGDELGKVLDYTEKMKADAAKLVEGLQQREHIRAAAKLVAEMVTSESGLKQSEKQEEQVEATDSD